MIIKDLNESFCKIIFEENEDEINLKIKITNLLSVYVDGYQFTPAFRAGFWDGKKHFWKIKDGTLIFPKGLVTSLIQKLKKDNYNVKYNYETYNNISEKELNNFIKSLNLPFKPYDYQKTAVLKCLNEGRKICVMATSSGKTLSEYILIRYLQKQNLKGLLIVPNVSLVKQIVNDFKEYGIQEKEFDNFHVIYAGKAKHFEKQVTISTWQSLYKSPELFSALDYICIDEVHLAKAHVYEHIIIPSSINCKYRFGFTGTLPQSYADRMSITASIGKSEKIINAQGLIERGLATPVEIICLYINYNNEDKKIVRRFKNYQNEMKFIENHKQRNEFTSKLANQVSKLGNTLLLFKKIDHGKLLLKNLLKIKFHKDNIKILEKITPKIIKEKYQEWESNKDINFYYNGNIDKEKIIKILKDKDLNFLNNIYSLQDYNIYFVYGKIDAKQREFIRKILEEKQNAILVASYQTTSTGINIKNLHNIIFGVGTKSSIRLNQSVGRGMRLFSSKKKIRIFDIVDDFSDIKNGKKRNINYALKHFDVRIESYLNSGFKILEKEIYLK